MDPKVFGPDIGIPRIVGEAKLRQLRDVDMPYAWASGPGFFAEKKVGAERVVTDAPEDNQPERPYFRASGRVSVNAVPEDEPTEVLSHPSDSPTVAMGRPGPNFDEELTGPLKVRAASALSRSFQTGHRSFGAYKTPYTFTWRGWDFWVLPTRARVRWGAYFGNHRDVVTQELMHPLVLNPSDNNGFAPMTGVAFRTYGDPEDDTRRWWTAMTFTQIVSVGFGRLGRAAPRYAFTVPVHSMFCVRHERAQYPYSVAYEARAFTSYAELVALSDGDVATAPFRHTMALPSVLVRPAAKTKQQDAIAGLEPGIMVAHTARMLDFQLGYHTRPAVSYFVEDRGDGTPYLRTDTLDIFSDFIPYEVDRTWIPYALETGGDGRTYVFASYSTPKSSAGLTVFNQPTVNSDRNPGIVLWWTRSRGAAWTRRICTEFRDMAFPSSYGLGTGGVTRPASSEPVTSPGLWDRSISEAFEGSFFPGTVLTCPIKDGVVITFTALKPDPGTFASGQPRFLKHPAVTVTSEQLISGEWGYGVARTQIFKVSGNTITKLYDVDNSALAQPISRMFLDMIYLGGNTLLAKVGPTYRKTDAWHYYQGYGVYGATDSGGTPVQTLGDGDPLNNWQLDEPAGCTILRSEDGGVTWVELEATGFPGSGVMGNAITVRDMLDVTHTVYPATPRPVQMSGRFTCVVPRLPKKADPDEFEDATVTVPGYDPTERAYFAYVSKNSGGTWERQGRIAATNRPHRMDVVGPNDVGRNFAKIEYIGTRRNPSPYNPALPTMLDPEPET